MTLEELKEARYSEIDQTTREIIAQGFEFPPQSCTRYSMSLTAQVNWSNLPLIPAGLYPIPVMSMTETMFNLDYATMPSFYGAALNCKYSALQSGSVLKEQIKACQTEAEVLAIVDNRYQP